MFVFRLILLFLFTLRIHAHSMNSDVGVCLDSLNAPASANTFLWNLPKDTILHIFVVTSVAEAVDFETAFLANNSPSISLVHRSLFLINRDADKFDPSLSPLPDKDERNTTGRRLRFGAAQVWTRAVRAARIVYFDRADPGGRLSLIELNGQEFARMINPNRVAIWSSRRLRFQILGDAIHPCFSPRQKRKNDQIQRAIAAIHASLSQNPDVMGWAKLAGMSRAVFYREFKAVTGMSVVDYHRQRRIREARRLIVEERMLLTQVALRLGFDNPASLSRLYKQIFAITPSLDQQRSRSSR